MPTHMISESEWRELVASRERTRMEEQTKENRSGSCPYCFGCEHLQKEGGCSCYTHCTRWLNWFSQEWTNIREAAARLRKESEEKHDD